MGLVLGKKSGIGFDKHWNVATGATLKYIYKGPTFKIYMSSIFLLGGKLVLVWGWFGQKVGAILGGNGVDFG